jgi:hypothetical protein
VGRKQRADRLALVEPERRNVDQTHGVRRVRTESSHDLTPVRMASEKRRAVFSVFSYDPFSDNFEAMDFLNATQLSKQNREKLAHGNAERLLKLSADAQSDSASRQSFIPNLKSSMFTLEAKVKANLTRRVLSVFLGEMILSQSSPSSPQ